MTGREVHESSGNIFADLGLPDAEDMLLKSKMVIEIRRLIETRKLTQTAAAKILGLKQGDLSKLLKGQLHGHSVERLIKMLIAFDQDVEIVMRPHPKAGEAGNVTFNAIVSG
jgi:predicted XRE-type DNA-binding protein